MEMLGVIESQLSIPVRHAPGHPLAGADGNIYSSNVNMIEEMVNMMLATRSYEANVAAFNATKNMAFKALEIGRG